MSAIVVDTSALIAILLNEPDADEYISAIASASHVLIAAPVLLETRIVVHAKLGATAQLELDSLIDASGIEIVAADASVCEIAYRAYARFGKGVGNPAVLNFGDCFAYALADSANLPLLFKGKDFSQTDIERA